MQYANTAVARAEFAKEYPWFLERGAVFPGARAYISEDLRANDALAFDAQPTLVTDPNSAIPSILTNYIDPDVFEVLFAPNKAAQILGEEKRGDWLMETAMFPVVEHTGEVSSYGDYNENGRAGANTNWPNFQSYLWQSIIQYGDRETERAGLARIGWVAELQKATATIHAKFANLTYLYGVAGLQNYGIVNNPYLAAALTPATKANGGVTWFTSGGSPNATANEVYNDLLAIFQALVVANQGLIDSDSRLVLALSPQSNVALGFTNAFNVNVRTLIKDNWPNMRLVVVPQYGAQSTADPQGNAGGNLVQMWAESIEGQKSGFNAFSEKMRAHRLIPALSSFKQKTTGGSWGAIIRMPVACSQMLGV